MVYDTIALLAELRRRRQNSTIRVHFLQCTIENMDRTLLFSVNFFPKPCVLAFEIAGARMLAPYLGTSTEVWAGLIAVILAGLAMGYWLGGRMAGASPTKRGLSWILLASAATALLAWGLRDAVPPLFIAFMPTSSLTYSAVFIAVILFAPTSILLGAVSPYIARLVLTDLDSAASVIGKLGAIGTVGSIAGTIATGAYLIPTFGLSSIILGVACVLAVLGLSLLTIGWRARGTLMLCLVFGLTAAHAVPPAYAEGIIADIETPYNRVRLGETAYNGRDLRYLRTDPFGVQCGMYLDAYGDPVPTELPFPYLKGFDIALVAVPKPARVLMLGGCNYSYPTVFLNAHPESTVTVVEIDPGMTEIAREWFGYKESPRMSIVHQDARSAINADSRLYDLIVMDTFTSFSSIPFELSTREMFAQMKVLTAPEGVLTLNVIGSLTGEHALFPSSLYQTIKTAYPFVVAYQIAGQQPERPQNLIFIASGISFDFPETVVAQGELFIRVPEVIMQNLETTGIVLTDNFAPVEEMSRGLREARFKHY